MTRTDFIKKVVDGFQLDANLEQIPSKVAASFVPVFLVNNPIPILKVLVDTTLNDSDKIISVPSGKIWKVLYGTIVLSATGVGNRIMRIDFRDELNSTLYTVIATAVQVDGTTEGYNLGQFGTSAEPRAGNHELPIPVNLWLSEGFDIRIFDENAIAVAVDDMTIRLVVEEYDIDIPLIR